MILEKWFAVGSEQRRRIKEADKEREKELNKRRYESQFTALLVEKLKKIDMILQKEKSVTIEVDPKDVYLVDKFQAGEELKNYVVDKNDNKFTFRLRTIDL